MSIWILRKKKYKKEFFFFFFCIYFYHLLGKRKRKRQTSSVSEVDCHRGRATSQLRITGFLLEDWETNASEPNCLRGAKQWGSWTWQAAMLLLEWWLWMHYNMDHTHTTLYHYNKKKKHLILLILLRKNFRRPSKLLPIYTINPWTKKNYHLPSLIFHFLSLRTLLK